MHRFDLDRIGAGLPVAAARDELERAAASGAMVVTAPPGTGKTTFVPPLVANLVAQRSDGAGRGPAASGSADVGSGSAAAGSTGTGSPGTGSPGTGSAGTGSAGTGSAGTGSATTESTSTESTGGSGSGARVLLTQPRRVAVRAAATRIAELDGSRIGGAVGFTVRGERRVGARTRIEVLTPGVLLRRLIADPELAGTAAVILDEVHERSVDGDLLLGMLAEARALREDLLVVAMSATLDAGRTAELLGSRGAESPAEDAGPPRSGSPAEGTGSPERGAGPSGSGAAEAGSAEAGSSGSGPAPVVEIPSALHPLRIGYAPFDGARLDRRGVTREYLAHLADTAAAAQAVDGCDALVFVPGAREVDETVRLLRDRTRAEVLPLHGSIPAREQDRAVRGRGRADPPRIVVSTSLAESSLTVPGVRLVIDAGLAREVRRDRVRGMTGLVTVSASRASAEQRAGRAARQA
ncbi:MAG: helicase-related protein, partial [Leucobacter sp.]